LPNDAKMRILLPQAVYKVKKVEVGIESIILSQHFRNMSAKKIYQNWIVFNQVVAGTGRAA